MHIVRHVLEAPIALRHSVLAIGNFDGLHLGHQALLAVAKEKAKTLGKPFAVMTFEPHPRHFFRPDLPPNNLFSFREKIEHFREMGVDLVHAVPFNRRFSDIPAKQFIEQILMQSHRVSHVVTGSDFVFGHDRGGNAALLESYAHMGAFGYTAFTPLQGKDGNKISSTQIRKLLADGNLGEATRLLGRPHTISGKVLHGDKRGRTFGFPTLNMALHNRFVPKFGIYAVTVKEIDDRIIGSSDHPIIYKGITNLGIRPMYQLDMPLLETHLFDVTGDWYGKRLSVELHHYIRPEMRFESEAELITQMRKDCDHAKSLLV